MDVEVDDDTIVVFELAKRLGEAAANMLEEAGLTETKDLVSLFGTAMAMAQAFAVQVNGSDLDDTIKVGANLVDNVTRALVSGDQPRFDA